MLSKIFAAPMIATITTCFFSCVTSHEAAADSLTTKVEKSKKSPISKASEIEGKERKGIDTAKKAADEPAKIQAEFQSEFARELAASGPNSEGWALFSDSSMGHNGQKWIIRTNDKKSDTVKLCVIAQQDSKCVHSDVTKEKFDKVSPMLQAGDKLSHVLPTSFDGTSFEYLHAKNSTPNTIRVVFIRSAKPFPAEYENLIKAFNSLNTKK